MPLTGLVNLAHAALVEGMDDAGVKRMDRVMMGENVPELAAKTTPRVPGAPPPRPTGVPVAPVGVRVREPEPSRGLEHLHQVWKS